VIGGNESEVANGGKFRQRIAPMSIAACTLPRKLVSAGGLKRSPKRCVSGALARSSTVGITPATLHESATNSTGGGAGSPSALAAMALATFP
jgi:hypothetical protein